MAGNLQRVFKAGEITGNRVECNKKTKVLTIEHMNGRLPFKRLICLAFSKVNGDVHGVIK